MRGSAAQGNTWAAEPAESPDEGLRRGRRPCRPAHSGCAEAAERIAGPYFSILLESYEDMANAEAHEMWLKSQKTK